MEIKLLCGCGTKYKFEVEPVNGRMPVAVTCPGCGANGTTDANQYLAQHSSPRPITVEPVPAPVAAPVAARPVARLASTPPVAVASRNYGPGYEPRSLLERTTFFVKERVGLLKLTDVYDILDPATGEPIGIAKEEPPTWAKWLRLLVNKQLLPTAVNIYEIEGQPPLVTIKRGFTILRSKIRIVSGDGRNLGYFKSKLISIGGGFLVYDHADQQVAQVKGNWKGWDFRFLSKSGREIGSVTKKWAGLGKELFTTADNYIISLTDLSNAGPEAAALLLAAGLSIDIVFKEAK